MGAGRSGTSDSTPVNKELIRTEGAGPSGATIYCVNAVAMTTINCIHNPGSFFPFLTAQPSRHLSPSIFGDRGRDFYISVIDRRS